MLSEYRLIITHSPVIRKSEEQEEAHMTMATEIIRKLKRKVIFWRCLWLVTFIAMLALMIW
jgi:hypothetical protein